MINIFILCGIWIRSLKFCTYLRTTPMPAKSHTYTSVISDRALANRCRIFFIRKDSFAVSCRYHFTECLVYEYSTQVLIVVLYFYEEGRSLMNYLGKWQAPLLAEVSWFTDFFFVLGGGTTSACIVLATSGHSSLAHSLKL